MDHRTLLERNRGGEHRSPSRAGRSETELAQAGIQQLSDSIFIEKTKTTEECNFFQPEWEMTGWIHRVLIPSPT